MNVQLLSRQINSHNQKNSTEYSLDEDNTYHNFSNRNKDSLDEESNVVRRHLAIYYQIIITFFYIFGIVGNVAALRKITRNEKKRFKKQILMLKSLALNDLLALVGSFILMYVRLYLSSANEKSLCAARVLLRAFGLGSGCVAFVMALERWLALSHPFTYQKHITEAVIRSFIYGLWTFNVLVVCAPFVGFGLWFDETLQKKSCVRYRFGTTTSDRTYAYFVFTFGMCLCVCIVGCNLSVIRVLCRMGNRLITRRHSGTSYRSTSSRKEPSYNLATPEELSFARLMAILSIFFVICWVPQLLTIIAAQHSLLHTKNQIYRAADVLIALNFTLDPYLYVLFRRQQLRKKRDCQKLGEVLVSSRRANNSSKRNPHPSISLQLLNGKEDSTGNFDKNEVLRRSFQPNTKVKESVPLALLL